MGQGLAKIFTHRVIIIFGQVNKPERQPVDEEMDSGQPGVFKDKTLTSVTM